MRTTFGQWGRFLAYCGISLIAFSISARESHALFTTDKVAPVPTWETELGLNAYYFNYLESLTPPVASQETGFLPAVRLGVTYHIPDHPKKLYFKLILDYSGANTTYNGTTQPDTSGNVTPLTSTTSNIFFNAELQSGMDFWKWGKRDTLGIFAGVGFHVWRRGDGVPTSSVGQSYRELYSWPYVLVGPRYVHRITTKWSFGANAELTYMPTGNLNIYLSDLTSENWANTSVTLGGTVGFRLEAPIRYQFKPTMAVSLTPWFQYSTIGQSNTVQILQPNGSPATFNGSNVYLDEPNSRTYQVGGFLAFILSTAN